MKRSNILIIAPLKEPYTGNALPVKYIYDKYASAGEVELVNLAKGSLKSGFNSFNRIVQILSIIAKVFFKQRNRDLIYLTVAESGLGNLRDLFIYFVTYFNNRKIVIHLLGGNSMKNILTDNGGIVYKLNKYFLNRLGGIIVEGKFQADFYRKVVSNTDVHIIPNFAQSNLFISESLIKKKFENYSPINILFLSNLIYGKGFVELVEAFINLSPQQKERFVIKFAGSFETEAEKAEFLGKIAEHTQLEYLGHVSGNVKANLFKWAHVFCLPTYYPYEGQPFVIVESYAAGCAVITTNHSGIGFIFRDGINGIEVEKKSVEDLKFKLIQLSKHPNELLKFAMNNFQEAKDLYNENSFLVKIEQVFKKIILN